MDTAIATLDELIGAAKKRGAEQAEVFFVRSEETPVKFEANAAELEWARRSEQW